MNRGWSYALFRESADLHGKAGAQWNCAAGLWMAMSDSTEDHWLSPDPLAGDISNPQSLNRYAYVLNNPTTLTDPLGLDPQQHSTTCYTSSCAHEHYGWGPYPGYNDSSYASGECVQDGVEGPCGSINWDSVAQCPNNLCEATGQDQNGVTHILTYWAFAGLAGVANGYYPGLGPLNPEAMGRYWADLYHSNVRENLREARGFIYEDLRAGIYVAGQPTPGTSDSSPFPGATPDYLSVYGGWLDYAFGDTFVGGDRVRFEGGGYGVTWVSTSTGRLLRDDGHGATCVVHPAPGGIYGGFGYPGDYPGC
jgi:hypothetical protein